MQPPLRSGRKAIETIVDFEKPTFRSLASTKQQLNPRIGFWRYNEVYFDVITKSSLGHDGEFVDIPLNALGDCFQEAFSL